MPDNFEARVAASTTSVVKLVFPHTTNHIGTLFGGTALQWMDEVAFITATRFCRQECVTISIDRTDFKMPIPAGSMVEVVGKVLRVGTTSMQIRVEIWIEQMLSEGRELAITGIITMVAVDKERRPVKVV